MATRKRSLVATAPGCLIGSEVECGSISHPDGRNAAIAPTRLIVRWSNSPQNRAQALRARFERYGPDGVHPKRTRARSGRPSGLTVIDERRIVAVALAWPTRGPQWISDELARLGATLSTSAQLDISTVSMSALAENLAPSLDLFADMILDPSFAAAEVERLKKQLGGLTGSQGIREDPDGFRRSREDY